MSDPDVTLPVEPAHELSDNDLEDVSGGRGCNHHPGCPHMP